MIRPRITRKAALVTITAEVAREGCWTQEALRARIEGPVSVQAANHAAAVGRAIYERAHGRSATTTEDTP